MTRSAASWFQRVFTEEMFGALTYVKREISQGRPWNNVNGQDLSRREVTEPDFYLRPTR